MVGPIPLRPLDDKEHCITPPLACAIAAGTRSSCARRPRGSNSSRTSGLGWTGPSGRGHWARLGRKPRPIVGRWQPEGPGTAGPPPPQFTRPAGQFHSLTATGLAEAPGHHRGSATRTFDWRGAVKYFKFVGPWLLGRFGLPASVDVPNLWVLGRSLKEGRVARLTKRATCMIRRRRRFALDSPLNVLSSANIVVT
jgi:hypothetical protein